jgi:hypothetical protein
MKRKEKAVAAGKVSNPSGTAVQRLKPERVQDGLAVRKTLQRIRVMERLDGMSGWKLAADSRAIARARKFTDPKPRDHRDAPGPRGGARLAETFTTHDHPKKGKHP